MESFIIAFIHRGLSGLQNGFGYAKHTAWLWAAMLSLMLYPMVSYKEHWLFYLFIGCNMVNVLMKTVSFTDDLPSLKKFKDIHLWENFVTGGFFLWLSISGHNILTLCCSVYPAMILHKGFINLGSKLDFFAEATDDATGKTYGIPILGIKIPRSGTKMRLILAGLSLITLGVILLMKWKLAFDLTASGS